MNKKIKLSIILGIFLVFGSFLVFSERLPIIGGDNNIWGSILNSFLNTSLDQNGTLRLKNSTNIQCFNNSCTYNGTSGFANPATENLDMDGHNIINNDIIEFNNGMKMYDNGQFNFLYNNFDKDLYFRINDGGVLKTGFYLDASDSGSVHFNKDISTTDGYFNSRKTGGYGGFVVYDSLDIGGLSGKADNGLILAVRETDGRANNNLILCEYNDRSDSFGHSTLSKDPTFWIHSATSPLSDTKEWISFTHNKTEGVIKTGKGDIYMKPASGIVYINGTLSAETIVDRTEAYQSTPDNALNELLNVKSTIDTKTNLKMIDHSSLPIIAQKQVPIINRINCHTRCMDCNKLNCSESDINNYNIPYQQQYTSMSNMVCNEFCDEVITYEESRDIGAMISVLTESIKALDTKNKELEERIVKLEIK